jgi:hypothetical protein
VTVTVGLLLVTVPLYAPALHLTGTDYRYEATTVRATDDGLAFGVAEREGRLPVRLTLRDVACYRPLGSYDRVCALEPLLLDGAVEAALPGAAYTADERFVYLRETDAFYRRTGDAAPGADGVGLDRVPPAELLEEVAVPSDAARESTVRAVEGGPVWVHGESRDAGRVVEHEGRYHVLYRSGARTTLSSDPAAERFVEAVAVAAGVLVLLRAFESGTGADD